METNHNILLVGVSITNVAIVNLPQSNFNLCYYKRVELHNLILYQYIDREAKVIFANILG